jgi:hypothetical protein
VRLLASLPPGGIPHQQPHYQGAQT